jgi:hypothetical protein
MESSLIEILQLLRGDEPLKVLAKFSRRVVEALGFEGYPCEIGYGFTHPDGRYVGWGEHPHLEGLPLVSVDGALRLIPPSHDGHGFIHWPGYDYGKLIAPAKAVLHHHYSSGGNFVEGYGATKAIALCIAALKAQAESEPISAE